MIINLDWLQFNCICSHQEELLKDTTQFHIRQISKTNVYDKWLIITYKGEKFLDVCFSPYSNIINADIVNVRLYNQWLYSDWLPILKSYFRVKKMRFNKLTRIDIAIDFQESEFDVRKMVKEYNQDKVIIKGKHKVCTYETTDGKERSFESMTINKLSSNNSMKWYNKTAELINNKDKSYIRAAWEAAGMEIEKEVFRSEITIKGDVYESTTGSQIDLEMIDDKAFIFKLFNIAYTSYFQLIKKGKCKKNINPFNKCNTDNAKLIRVRSTNKSTRMVKYVVNQVVRTIDEYYNAEKEAADIEVITEFLARYMRDSYPAHWNRYGEDSRIIHNKLNLFV